MINFKEYTKLNEINIATSILGASAGARFRDKENKITYSKKILSLIEKYGFTFNNEKYKLPCIVNHYPFLDCYKKFSNIGLVFVTYNKNEFKFRIFGGEAKYVDTYFSSKEADKMISAIESAKLLINDLNSLKKEILDNLVVF